MTDQEEREVRRVADMAPNLRNPRSISPERLAALKESVERFGDLSGFTYNFRTDRMICAHQRRRVILDLDPSRIRWGAWRKTRLGPERHGYFQLPGGSRFTVRGVRWDEDTEAAALVAANSQHLAGEFTADVSELLEAVRGSQAELFEAVMLDRLVEDFKPPEPPPEFPIVDEDLPTEHTCPKCGYEWSGGTRKAKAKDEKEEGGE